MTAASQIVACDGKKIFDTYAAAERALKLQRRRRKGRDRDLSTLNIYRCECCRKWHLGNRQKEYL